MVAARLVLQQVRREIVSEDPLGVLVGRVIERTDRQDDRLDDIQHRLTSVETRPVLSPDTALWADGAALHAKVEAVKDAERLELEKSIKRAVITGLVTAPVSLGIGFLLAHLLPYIHVLGI